MATYQTSYQTPYEKFDKHIKELLWDFLIENEIATEDEIRLVTDIAGYTEETMLDILFARTGYRSIDQIAEVDEEGLYISNELLDAYGLLKEEDAE
jgi:hypothetical protein